MSEKVRTFEFHSSEDYRGNLYRWIEEYIEDPQTLVRSYPEQSEDSNTDERDEHAHVGDLVIPVIESQPDKFRVFFYAWEQTFKCLAKFDDLDEARQLCLEIHSHVNGTGPFVQTGFTGSYKPTGDYSNPVAIKHPDIVNPIDIDFCGGPCVAAIFNNAGDLLRTLSIMPRDFHDPNF